MSLFILPTVRATDADNLPLPGATLTFYTTGTTTLATVYTTSALSVAHTNPVVADAGGLFPGIYLDPSVTYRAVLKSALGVTIDDIDPYTQDDSGSQVAATRTALAAIASPVSGSTAILVEAGREGMFVFDDSDLSTEVAADTQQGVYVALSTDATGASGAWVRKFTGPLQVEWFGANNAGFAAMLALASALDTPAAVTNQSVLVTAQHSIPEGVTLIIDGGELYATDNTLASTLLISAADVTLECRNGGRVRGALTSALGATGICVYALNSTGFRCRGLRTEAGKYGLATIMNDDMQIEDVVVHNSSNWGIVSAGNRDFEFRDCRVDTTRDTSASDCFKIFGAGNDNWSTRSSYGGKFINCDGSNASGVGQSFDVISDNDAVDDLYDIAFINPTGRDCPGGFFEIKVTAAVTTQYPMHGITVQGGAFSGALDASASGVKVAERVYDIEFNGTKVSDVTLGFFTAGPCRQIRFNDCTAVRPRQNGFIWTGTSSTVGNQINSPTVIDPNYGQGASTYAGISIQGGTNLVITNPTVIRSQEPSGSAHSYGIEILAAASKVSFEGAISLKDHATGPISNATTGCTFPTSLTIPATSLSSSASAVNVAGDTTQGGAFVPCAYTVMYSVASNVARGATLRLRNSGTTTDFATFNTSATATLYQADQTVIAAPQRIPGTQPTLAMNLAAVTLPGSPTGSIVVKVHGYRDVASS